MQLVGTDKILGFLCNTAVFICGEQLGADGRAEHVVQSVCQGGLPVCLIPICGKTDQSAHKRFGNTAVDAVVGHMVTVIGCPAEYRLGKVTRTNDKTVAAVCHVHKHLRAFARLAVFIYDVTVVRIMPDVFEVQGNRFTDRNLTEINAKLLAKHGRVVFGSACRTKAGHGNGDQLACRHVEGLECIHGD